MVSSFSMAPPWLFVLKAFESSSRSAGRRGSDFGFLHPNSSEWLRRLKSRSLSGCPSFRRIQVVAGGHCHLAYPSWGTSWAREDCLGHPTQSCQRRSGPLTSVAGSSSGREILSARGCVLSSVVAADRQVSSRVARTCRAALDPASAAPRSAAPSLRSIGTYLPWLRSWMRSMVEGSIRAGANSTPERMSGSGSCAAASVSSTRSVAA